MTKVIEVIDGYNDNWLCTIMFEDTVTDEQLNELRTYMRDMNRRDKDLTISAITSKIMEMKLAVCQESKLYTMWVGK